MDNIANFSFYQQITPIDQGVRRGFCSGPGDDIIALVRIVLAFILISVNAHAAVLARWQAGAPVISDNISVAAGPDHWTIEQTANGSVAAIEPSQDYYRRAAFVVTIAKPAAGWLSVEYLDRGYALITISPGVPQRDQSGVARLNTGKLRHAIFRLNASRLARPLRLEGVGYLRSLTFTDTEPTPEPVPDVQPAITFRRYGERVTTAGTDANTPDQLPEALASMRNLLPLAKALGFNGIESYVKWNFVERSPGVFDWSYYDAVVNEIEKHGMRWFPLIIVGSAYTLPQWYHDSKENVGYVCLEHHMRNDIQTIFCDNQRKYVRRFLLEFGKHYASRKVLLGVRLGPSGNYGEAQYPARGNLGYKGQPIHTHIGYWAGDPYAALSFQQWLRRHYTSIDALNQAWKEHWDSFEQIRPFLPATALSPRKRIDFDTWYMDSMSEWCEQWAKWAREAMPNTVIDQSSGGWGPVEIGTDYSYQARSMAKLKGGVRLTNESDNYPLNFAITRMASSAARYYGAHLGYEPGGFGTMRGVMARLYNCVTNGGDHLFYYHGNLYSNDQAIDRWLQYAHVLDRRAKPMIDVAAFYPDTTIKLDDETIRYLWGASAFLTKAEALRSSTDFDYVSEQMVQDGALDRYKVLVFLWGYVTEKPVLDRIAQWVEKGGTLIYPERPRGLLSTVEEDTSQSRKWLAGDTGKGRVIFYPGDMEPGSYYANFVLEQLRQLPQLRPEIRSALRMKKPSDVYWSLLDNGTLLLLNFSDEDAEVRLAGGKVLHLKPYTIETQ